MNSIYNNAVKMAEVQSSANIQRQVDGKIHVSENAFQAANAENLKSIFSASELPGTNNISKDKKPLLFEQGFFIGVFYLYSFPSAITRHLYRFIFSFKCKIMSVP